MLQWAWSGYARCYKHHLPSCTHLLICFSFFFFFPVATTVLMGVGHLMLQWAWSGYERMGTLSSSVYPFTYVFWVNHSHTFLFVCVCSKWWWWLWREWVIQFRFLPHAAMGMVRLRAHEKPTSLPPPCCLCVLSCSHSHPFFLFLLICSGDDGSDGSGSSNSAFSHMLQWAWSGYERMGTLGSSVYPGLTNNSDGEIFAWLHYGFGPPAGFRGADQVSYIYTYICIYRYIYR